MPFVASAERRGPARAPAAEAGASFVLSSLDHLGGALQQRQRNRDAHRFGSLQIDGQLELRRLLHRQVARFRTLEYLVDESRGSAPVPRIGGVVEHQSTGGDIFARAKDA